MADDNEMDLEESLYADLDIGDDPLTASLVQQHLAFEDAFLNVDLADDSIGGMHVLADDLEDGHILQVLQDDSKVDDSAPSSRATEPYVSSETGNHEVAIGPNISAHSGTTASEGGEDSNEGMDSDDDGTGSSDAEPKDPSRAVEQRGYYITSVLDTTTESFDDGTTAVNYLDDHLRCLNDEILWTLSTARPGNGIDELLDPDVSLAGNTHDTFVDYVANDTAISMMIVQLTTFWQSDGMGPHHVTMNFYKRQSVAEVAIYLDYPCDESYTPNDIIIRAGHIQNDTEEIVRIKLNEPAGWVRIPFVYPLKAGLQRYLRAHVITATIVSNHQAGRDCHVRAIKVLGPGDTESRFHLHPFSSAAASSSFAEIR